NLIQTTRKKNMDKNSKPYKDGRYSELFDAAESSHVVGEDAVLYSQSLTHMRNVEANYKFRFEEGRAEGLEEGRAEGRAEGKHDIARKMLAKGEDPDRIFEYTGITIDELNHKAL
ncbi:MAG: hypothetical protein K2K97_05455, partial [Muribaculaceae bacterium]|nr:hypothetical protein [Muribaculaceae bacterium]